MPSIRITRNNRVTHVMQYSLHVRNVEIRVNLDLWILVLVVEYLGCMLSTIFLLCIGGAYSLL